MTPQEHDLVTQLFDRLAALEAAPRDPEAERAIIEGLRRAPNAVYALVQTALVQDEALRRANARIAELTAGRDGDQPVRPTGFLDGMRDALLGRPPAARAGSVPSVHPPQGAGAGPAGYAPIGQSPMPTAGGGGSFLGTAAAAAAGMIGGSLLLDGIRSMMGPHHGTFAAADPAFGAHERHAPWGSDNGGDLAHQAGIDDIGTSGHGDAETSELYDGGSGDDAIDADDDQFGSDFGGDGGSDFGGGSDFA
jgi:hypothetical protein